MFDFDLKEKIIETFELFASYGQIAVFHPHLENPFNEWRDEHMNQGFSWREQSVACQIPQDSAVFSVKVLLASSAEILANAERALQVPFRVHLETIEIASITESHLINIPPGNYALVFSCWLPEEAGNEEIEGVIQLCFVPAENPTPQIFKIGAGMQIPETFLMSANPG